MRILWLKTELLHPADKGGKIRTYHMLKALKAEHHLTYLTLDDGSAAADAVERASEYCHDLITVPHRIRARFSVGFYAELLANLVSPLPYFMQKYVSEPMRLAIGRALERQPFDVLVCDFLMPSVNVPRSPACASILFQHNVEAAIWRRHWRIERHPLKKAYLYGQWLKTRRFERAACRRFDRVIAVSREDADIMRTSYRLGQVSDVPTGVDTAYFQPVHPPLTQPHHLVFTGSMDWLPNEDAVRFFVEHVLPRIRAVVPDVTLTIVGRSPSPAVVRLGQSDPGIEVTGRVDDVRPYIDRAAIYVVPIRIGGGTRLKIFEAMAMGKAVVSTTVGAEGLPVRDGTELLLADTPEALARAVIRVLNNPSLASDIGRAAAARVRTEFGWETVAARFAEICLATVRERPPNHAWIAVAGAYD